jgi:hypothetical protein
VLEAVFILLEFPSLSRRIFIGSQSLPPYLVRRIGPSFGYTVYPEYSAREVMTTGQLLRCEVKVKIPVCPTNPAWEEWECKEEGRNLADTVQKAALKALTTFCGKHPDEVAGSAVKVIPVPEQHSVPCVEREAFLSAQSNSHYSPDLVTLVRFSEAMYDT